MGYLNGLIQYVHRQAFTVRSCKLFATDNFERTLKFEPPSSFQVRSEVQRAAHLDLGGGRVQLQAEVGVQARAGAQHNAG